MRVFFYFILFAGILTACKVVRLPAAEYLDYVFEHESDFTVSVQSSDSKVSLIYSPFDETLANAQLSGVAVDELKAARKDQTEQKNSAFVLKYEFKSGGLLAQSKAPSAEQMKFYAVDFKQHIVAITANQDTLKCTNYIFEANGNFGNVAYFNFDFNERLDQLKKIQIQSPYLTDSILEFVTEKYNTNYPELKIK